MHQWATLWCQLFGYSSCQALSTFEAIVLAVVAGVTFFIMAVIVTVFVMTVVELGRT